MPVGALNRQSKNVEKSKKIKNFRGANFGSNF